MTVVRNKRGMAKFSHALIGRNSQGKTVGGSTPDWNSEAGGMYFRRGGRILEREGAGRGTPRPPLICLAIHIEAILLSLLLRFVRFGLGISQPRGLAPTFWCNGNGTLSNLKFLASYTHLGYLDKCSACVRLRGRIRTAVDIGSGGGGRIQLELCPHRSWVLVRL